MSRKAEPLTEQEEEVLWDQVIVLHTDHRRCSTQSSSKMVSTLPCAVAANTDSLVTMIVKYQ